MKPEIGPSRRGGQPHRGAASTASDTTTAGSSPAGQKSRAESSQRGDGLDLSAPQRQALQARQPDALEAFFDAYFTPLYQYLWRMVGHAQLAEDLTQETFMQIHRSLDRYDPTRPLKPWVYTIATNLVRDHWRSRQHREQTQREDWEDGHGRERLADNAPSPDRSLESDEGVQEVAQAVEKLPETLRTTFVLRFYEGLSFGEIATLVERNEVAVRKRFSRALEELRTRLAHLDPSGQGFLRDGRVH